MNKHNSVLVALENRSEDHRLICVNKFFLPSRYKVAHVVKKLRLLKQMPSTETCHLLLKSTKKPLMMSQSLEKLHRLHKDSKGVVWLVHVRQGVFGCYPNSKAPEYNVNPLEANEEAMPAFEENVQLFALPLPFVEEEDMSEAESESLDAELIYSLPSPPIPQNVIDYALMTQPVPLNPPSLADIHCYCSQCTNALPQAPAETNPSSTHAAVPSNGSSLNSSSTVIAGASAIAEFFADCVYVPLAPTVPSNGSSLNSSSTGTAGACNIAEFVALAPTAPHVSTTPNSQTSVPSNGSSLNSSSTGTAGACDISAFFADCEMVPLAPTAPHVSTTANSPPSEESSGYCDVGTCTSPSLYK